MLGNLIKPLGDRIFNKSLNNFWTMQIGFWLFLCFVSVFTLSLWYDQSGFNYFLHTGLQSVFGLVMTMPLVHLYLKQWDKSILLRFAIAFIAVMGVSFLWTIVRMELFTILTDEPYVWQDLGGWYFGSIFIFFGWTGLFHGLRYYQLLQHEHQIMLKAEAGVREEHIKRMMAQTVARDAKIKMLRYQLNPHFLCNTLNAINSLIETEDNEKAQSMTVQLSKFLRFSLDHNPDTKIALENEINALNLYLEIEKTRFADRLKLDFQISPLAQKANIPSLLLQPIIENSMKHVIAQNEDGGTIMLRANVVENRLVLELSDTGTGVSVDKSKLTTSKGRGVGLKNIDERLKALYNLDYVFDLQLLPLGGLKTVIEIPFENLAMDKQ